MYSNQENCNLEKVTKRPWDPGDSKFNEKNTNNTTNTTNVNIIEHTTNFATIQHTIQNELPNSNIHKRECFKISKYLYYTPPIGKGSFSKVYLGYDPENRMNVAIKKVSLKDTKKMSLSRLQREIKLLKKLNHPNIVRFIDTFTDISDNVYVITEYCNYGSLEKFIGGKGDEIVQLFEDEIKTLIYQLKEGLRYLLTNNILHRDIKPQNILLHRDGDEINIKIADFGFAKHFEVLEVDSMMETLCGTPLYLAPEIIIDKKYTLYSDLWSVGIIMYQLFYHTTPFQTPKNILELIRNIEKLNIIFKKDTSNNAQDLMKTLLNPDPVKRIDWGNFFNHTWFESDSKYGNSSLLSTLISTRIIKREKKIDNEFSSTTSSNSRDEQYSTMNIFNNSDEDNKLLNSDHIHIHPKTEPITIKNTINNNKININTNVNHYIANNTNNNINNNNMTINNYKRDSGDSYIKVMEPKNPIIKSEDTEYFLQQSSKLFITPKLYDNYIPESTSLPNEKSLGFNKLYEKSKKMSSSSISPVLSSKENNTFINYLQLSSTNSTTNSTDVYKYIGNIGTNIGSVINDSISTSINYITKINTDNLPSLSSLGIINYFSRRNSNYTNENTPRK